MPKFDQLNGTLNFDPKLKQITKVVLNDCGKGNIDLPLCNKI